MGAGSPITPALGCAVAYPLGVVGSDSCCADNTQGAGAGKIWGAEREGRCEQNLTLRRFKYTTRPFSIKHQRDGRAELSKVRHFLFVEDGNVSIPTSEKIMEGDRLLVVTSKAPALTVLFGEQEHTDWNKEDID